MKTLFTDASFDYHHTDETTENVVRGKIAISDDGNFRRIEKVAIGKVPKLRQYINVLELTAIARAIEIASEMTDTNNFLQVNTDSKVAMIWASSKKVHKKVETEAHRQALEYLRKSCQLFGGVITFAYIPREENPAGHLLEVELEREKPHAL